MSIARFHVIFTRRYQYKLLDIFGRSSVIALWPLTETNEITAQDISGNARHGTYFGPTLANLPGPRGVMAPMFDGVNDFCNIYSAGLNTAFNGAEGTILIWSKVTNAGVWTDGLNRALLHLGVNGTTNYVRILKSSSVNTLNCSYVANSVSKFATGTLTTLSWFMTTITWSASGDALKMYVNNAQHGGTATALGAWAGALASNMCAIGAQTTTPALPFSGWLQYALLLNRAATLPEISRAFNAR